MAFIPPEVVEQIFASTDILRLIGEKVELKRVGSRYRGLCPFHNEKTPSFYVDPERQRYHCFGCGADGSAAGWLIEYENRSYPEALQILAQMANIPLQLEEETPKERAARAGRESALGALAAASAYFSKLLWESDQAAHAREYLQSRALDPETASDWGFGYAPEQSKEFLAWAKSQRLSGRSLVDSGLASLRDEERPQAGLYARFRNRLMFPIRDDQGKVVGFSGRILEADAKAAKYINTPETPYFKKGNLLFGLDRARRPILQKKRVILCEGQLDCIAMHQAGFSESLAPMGTATTPDHARKLARLGQEVILLFDGDKAGQAAALRSAQILLPESLPIRVATLPEGEDPDSFLKQQGAQPLEELLLQAVDYFSFLLEHCSAENKLSDTQGRQQFVEQMVESLQLVPDAIVLDALILQTAARLGVPDGEIRQRVEQARRRNQGRKMVTSSSNQGGSPPAANPHENGQEVTQRERQIPLPNSPLNEHLCLLLLLAHSRPILLEKKQALLEWLQKLGGSPLAEHLLEITVDPSQSSSLNSALDSLPKQAKLWAGTQLQQSPSAQANEEQQRQFALEVLYGIELKSLKRQLQSLISQMKVSSGLNAQDLAELQRNIQELRKQIHQLEQRSA